MRRSGGIMLKNPRFVVIVLGVAAVVSSVAGYFYGAGAWPAKVEDAPPTLRSGPPALWTQGGAFITPLGARRQLRGVALPPGAGPDDVRAALAPGVSAVGVVVEPDAYRDDPDLRQRVDEAVTVAAEAGVYPVVSAAGPAGGGACGDGDIDGTEFWSAIAENLGGRPWIVYDLGASGCTDDWDRQRLLAASAADAIRVHAPEALVIVPAPEGMTAPLLAAAPVERQGIGYRILGAEPNPTGPAPLRVMSDLPLVLELPDLPAAGDRTLTARTAVSDLVAAGAAGWFLPADAVGPLSDAVSKAFSGAARTER
ncbi:MAG: hypothetical protein NTZ05_21030, partial [Chloroflexi bacterium]|nr:hypothetical protein [Chloroflexota bacterium]